MNLSGQTIQRVHARLLDLQRRPRLFDDRMPPSRVRARLTRFRAWCGPLLWTILSQHEAGGTKPAPDVGRWRCSTRHTPQQQEAPSC